MDAPAGFLTGLAQGLQKEFVVGVVFEDRFATVAAIHDVVDGTGVLDAHFSGHEERQTPFPIIVNTIILGTDPFSQ